MTVSHFTSGKMAGKTILFSFFALLSIIGINADGELNILHSPDSLKFSGSSKAVESLLKEIFSASLGLSVEANNEWDGLTISDPFNTPEAVVEVYIDGVSSLSNAAHLKGKSYPLIADEYEPETYNEVEHRIRQRFSSGGNKLVSINLAKKYEVNAYPEIFGEINVPAAPKQTYMSLKLDVEEDKAFLNELEAIKAIAAKVREGVVSADNIIDFYYFRFRSLHALSDFHGPNSMQTKEAKKLLGEALQELSSAFSKAYDGSVLVTAVSTDVAHTRRVRRAANDRQAQNPYAEDKYSADYPAIFNIILWFGVVFTFSLLAIVYAVMDMDPGRDSIIYRMTNTRIKKDN